MDKPISLSVKHFLIRNMSVKMMLQESLIETIVNHQFESAYVALEDPQCFSMEFSGFGKLLFNKKKALKKLEKQNSQIYTFEQLLLTELSPIRRRNLEMKLSSAKKNLEHLKKKTNELVSDI
jgi:hypothetical protein